MKLLFAASIFAALPAFAAPEFVWIGEDMTTMEPPLGYHGQGYLDMWVIQSSDPPSVEQETSRIQTTVGTAYRDKLLGLVGVRMPRPSDHRLGLAWQFRSHAHELLVGVTGRWLLERLTSVAARVSTEEEQFSNAFDHRQTTISLSLGQQLSTPKHTSVSIGYDSRLDGFSDVAEGLAEPPDRTTNMLRLSIRRDTRDLLYFPTSGTVASYVARVSSSQISSDLDFHQHEFKYNAHLPVQRFVIGLEARLAAIDGFSGRDDSRIPFSDHFAPGGIDWEDGQVRGYNEGSLGPRDSAGRILGGRSMMTMAIECRVPITDRQTQGLFFIEAGNAWSGIPDVSPLDLRHSAGVGLRVLTPASGMLELDIAYGFDRRDVDGEKAGVKGHFQFGPRLL